MAERLRFLVVEDSEADFYLHVRNLNKHGMAADLKRVDTFVDLERALEETVWDAVISDFSLPGMDFTRILAAIKNRLPGVPVILVSGSIGEEAAVDLLKEGVWDFVWKDRPARLAPALAHCLEKNRSRKARVMTENALRSSESRYRTLFENMMDAYAHCEIILENGVPVDWIYLAVNPSFERLTGLKDVVGRRVSQVIPGLDVAHSDLLKAYGRVAASGHPERLENYLDPLGIWLSIAVYSPAPGEFVEIFENISERKGAESSLREAMYRLEMAITAGGYGVWDLDIRTGRMVWDERLHRIFGLEPVAGIVALEVWKAFIHPEDRARVQSEVATAIHLRRDVGIRLRIHRADGTLRHLNCLGIGELDPGGEPTRMFGLLQDVTEQVEAEQARIASEEERRSLEAQVRHAEKLESLGSLASGVAHDMNNVLAAILAVAQVLHFKLDEDPGMVSALETIIKAANRGRDLVRGLTNFARKDLRAAEPLDLNRLVREEADLLNRTLRQKIRLEVELEEPQAPFLGEPGNFGSALMNLCVNAVDAMPDGGTLSLRTRTLSDGWLELAVEDTGTGMPPEVLNRAMEPFFTTKEVGKGTGLGLAMVHGTVKSHGGTLDIQSEVGRGTCIRIRLPALAGPVPGPAGGPESRARGRRSLRVLVVDDDELIQATVPLLLQHLGHRPLSALSGEEALERLEAGLETDAVILDLNMPGLGGEATYLRLRRLRPTLPVLVATGFMDPSTDTLLQGDPLAGSLSKPFSIEELSRKMAALPVAEDGRTP